MQVVFVAEDALVVLGGKRRVSAGGVGAQVAPEGRSCQSQGFISTSVLRCCTGEAASPELPCLERVPFLGTEGGAELPPQPVPGLSDANGCGEPVCANLCQTHQGLFGLCSSELGLAACWSSPALVGLSCRGEDAWGFLLLRHTA